MSEVKRIRQAQCPQCGHWNSFNGNLRSMMTSCESCGRAFNHTAVKQKFVDVATVDIKPDLKPYQKEKAAPLAIAVDGKSYNEAAIRKLLEENLRLTAHCNGLVTTLASCLHDMELTAISIDSESGRSRSAAQLWKDGAMTTTAKIAKETIELATGSPWEPLQ